MAQLFISYSSKDIVYAFKLYQFLQENGYSIWLAPLNIQSGKSFLSAITQELLLNYEPSVEERLDLQMKAGEEIEKSQAIILLLNRHSMNSQWVKREISFAISQNKLIIPLKIDHEPLTPQFEFLLGMNQIHEAYHLTSTILKEVLSVLKENNILPNSTRISSSMELPTYEELQMESISRGDPYFVLGESLKTRLSSYEFYLAPPADLIKGLDPIWVKEHFTYQDEVFSKNLEEICQQVPIPHLKEEIEKSRHIVFQQFINRENGCYFNNKKYGIYDLNPYGRSEDNAEIPILEITFYTTDYFTHRVMKDVCKRLIKQKILRIENIPYFHLSYYRIFFTSLGINLILTDSLHTKSPKVLLTNRSFNASETDPLQRQSISVIEGVSLSDFDPFLQQVNLHSAVIRGLKEELGIDQCMIQNDSLFFYELFMNQKNLEMGLSCSIELKENFSLNRNLLNLHGKDEDLEISDKKTISRLELIPYTLKNRKNFWNQAAYTILSYGEGISGKNYIDRNKTSVVKEEQFSCPKNRKTKESGDSFYRDENFVAVFDGATPKGKRTWNGLKGDVFVANLLKESMKQLNPTVSPQEAISFLNHKISEAYLQNNIKFEDLAPEEQLQASLIIYSNYRKEIWNFGDCKLRINKENITHLKKIDKVLSELRTFVYEIAMVKDTRFEDLITTDYGRSIILPFLKCQNLLANKKGTFSYDVLNGGQLNLDHIQIYPVHRGDHIVLASDGYPKLFDTLEQSETYLQEAIKVDPHCLYELQGTKGIEPGNQSFDDRTFVSFTIK